MSELHQIRGAPGAAYGIAQPPGGDPSLHETVTELTTTLAAIVTAFAVIIAAVHLIA